MRYFLVIVRTMHCWYFSYYCSICFCAWTCCFSIYMIQLIDSTKATFPFSIASTKFLWTNDDLCLMHIVFPTWCQEWQETLFVTSFGFCIIDIGLFIVHCGEGMLPTFFRFGGVARLSVGFEAVGCPPFTFELKCWALPSCNCYWGFESNNWRRREIGMHYPIVPFLNPFA